MEKEYKIYTYTIIHVPTEEFKGKTPYLMVLAEKPSGERFLSRVKGYKEGMEVSIGGSIYFDSLDENSNIICKL